MKKVTKKTRQTRQSVKSIMENIDGNGGFDNFNNWNRKQIAEWVKHTFNCSTSLANNVSYKLI